MSYKQHTYPLHIQTAVSPCLVTVIVVLHAMSIFAILLTSIDWSQKIVLVALVSLHFIYCLKYSVRSASIVWKTDNSWSVSYADKNIGSARLLGSSVVSRWFAWLHFCSEERGRTFGVLLVRDSLPRDKFRRLRVRLKAEGAAS